MKPEKGEYESLLGYITLEECGALLCEWSPIDSHEIYGCEFLSSGLRLSVVQPLIGSAAGGKPILQLFLQRFGDCGALVREVD